MNELIYSFYILRKNASNLDNYESMVKSILDEKKISFKDGNNIIEAIYTENNNKGKIDDFEKDDIIEEQMKI